MRTPTNATECRMRNDRRGSRSIASRNDLLQFHHPRDYLNTNREQINERCWRQCSTIFPLTEFSATMRWRNSSTKYSKAEKHYVNPKCSTSCKWGKHNCMIVANCTTWVSFSKGINKANTHNRWEYMFTTSDGYFQYLKCGTPHQATYLCRNWTSVITYSWCTKPNDKECSEFSLEAAPTHSFGIRCDWERREKGLLEFTNTAAKFRPKS